MEQKDLVFLIIFISVFLVIFIGGSVLYILQSRKKKIESIKEKEKSQIMHQQEILSTQLEMQTQTMQHIGREIHDNVGQKLTLASLYTQQLAYENKAPHINDKIESIGTIINESLAELRQLSKSLTDDTINDNTIYELLQQECENVNNVKKAVVTFTNNKKNIVLPYQTKSILVRIVQEFLQNSLKHAHCKNIIISLSENDNLLQLLLQDDGKGFDTNAVAHKGIGLSNIKKRVEMIGGKYILESVLDKGTKLTIEIPNNK
jgi:signal transduction histidine kinase